MGTQREVDGSSTNRQADDRNVDVRHQHTTEHGESGDEHAGHGDESPAYRFAERSGYSVAQHPANWGHQRDRNEWAGGVE